MKLLHFVVSAGGEEYFVNAGDVTMVTVGDSSSVNVFFKNSGNEGDHSIDCTTTTNKADEVASRISQEIAQGNNDVFVVTALSDVSAAAFSAGT